MGDICMYRERKFLDSSISRQGDSTSELLVCGFEKQAAVIMI